MTNLLDDLTNREQEVLSCLVEGLSNAEIASQLHLAPQTVRWYNSQIYSKLGVKNRRAAASRAVALELLQPERNLEAIRNNIPAETTPFIGRDKELEELTEFFADKQIRLITILALGGMGKTRLVLKLAKQLIQNHVTGFEDGIFFIPLLPLTDPQHIVAQIGVHIGYKFTGDRTEQKQQLLDYLSDKRILLVMDNWEHLLAGSLLINDLLSAAPHLRVLATSREKLNLSGETVYSIEGMRLPIWETPDDASQSDAVQLFVQTARRVRPDWRVETSNLHYVKQVSQLTQGMPLGIVLAASWLDTLSIRDIADELKDNIDLLTSEMRDIPTRQQSIRAIFNYSWKQLQPDERQVFMKLSVFRGGFTRNAAQVVCNANTRILQALVNKALITRTNTDRYEVHELLRQYAEEQLQQSKNFDIVVETYYQYFLDWLAGIEVDIKGRRQVGALVEVEDDFDNIRRAWSFALQHNNFELIWKSSESLYLFCEMRSLFTEGQELFSRALTDVTANADFASAWSRFVLCKERLYEAPRPSVERSRAIQIAQETANLEDMALGYLINGRSKWIYQGEVEDALQFFEQAYAIYQQNDDEFYLAYAINRIGLCHSLIGNRRKGIDLTQQSAEMQRLIGDYSGLGISLNNLGAFNYLEGDYDLSTRLLRESIAVSQQSQNGGNLVFAYGILSLVYFSGAEFGKAQELATRASQMGQDIGYIQGASLGFSSLGLLSSVVGENYDQGFRSSQKGRRLAKKSNVGLQTFSLCGIVLALCGLGDFDQLPAELGQLVDQNLFSATIWGFISVVWTVYSLQKQHYEQAVVFLSFVMNSDIKTFQWVKQWSLLQQLETDLRAQMDEAIFNIHWNEGRQASLDKVIKEILSNFE
jgi:predicted ATPase/DNA-binding CsgD family transcriptional regulator